MIKKIISFLVIGLISTLGMFTSVWAANTGTYTSAKIGEDKVSSFISFKVIDQSKPSGSNITYQFAGSKDDFNSWSEAQATDSSIDLSGISQLKSSNYLKVRINLSSDNNNLPSVGGFEISYDVLGTTTNGSPSASSSSSEKSSSSGSSSQSTSPSSSSSSSSSSTPTSTNGSSSTSSEASTSSSNQTADQAKTTQSKTISLSKNQLNNKLVATGSNLWVNLSIALVLSILISYFILKRKSPQQY